jgi:hypothetical protein
VPDGCRGISGGALRGAPGASAFGGVPHARLGQRGGRRRPGGLATAQPLRHQRRGEPRRLADDGRGARLPQHAALARGPLGRPRPRPGRGPGRGPRGHRRPRPGGAARRLGGPGAARGPRHAVPGRAARVRPARHVRPALRRDRPHRRPLPGGHPPARRPRPPPGAGNGRDSRPLSRPSARSRRRLPRRLTRRRLRRAARTARPGRRPARRQRGRAVGRERGPRCGGRGQHVRGPRQGRSADTPPPEPSAELRGVRPTDVPRDAGTDYPVSAHDRRVRCG